jgi:hypothetical protein
MQHGHDMRVLDLLGDPRLAVEPAPEGVVTRQIRLDDLDRHLLAVCRRGQIHVTHPADAEHRLDRVRTYGLPDAVVAGRSCLLLAHAERLAPDPHPC